MAIDTEKLHMVDNQLQKHALNSAIRTLREVADSIGDADAISMLQTAEDVYSYLRQYFMTGNPDPSRGEMLSRLAEQLRGVRDRLLRQSRREGTGAYYASLRLVELRKYNTGNLLKEYREVMAQVSLAEMVGDVPEALRTQRYDLLDRIFMAVMTSFHDDEADDAVKDAIYNSDADTSLRMQLTYALALGLAAAFDASKVAMLLDLAMNESMSEQLQAVAYVGIAIAFMAYPDRLSANRDLAECIRTFTDTPECVARMRSVIKAVAGTRDTERVANKVKDEVIPEIMKIRPDMLGKLNDLSADMDPESLENNPDWQEMLDKSGITRKLEELSEMMSDGADLMMVTFSQLKKFPFFQRINNWFLPFDIDNPNLHVSEEDRNFMEKLSSVTDFICDSDKYSLALAIAQTPSNHRHMVMSQFNAQFEQMHQEIREKLPSSGRPDFDREVVKSVRDLYRYIFLGRNTGDFFNIFKSKLDFTHFPIIGDRLKDADFLSVMSEFYMKRGFYSEALVLFQQLAGLNQSESSVWQKIGFCRQKAGNFPGAREAYMKSELLGDSSKWLVKKLAFVNRKLGDFASALEYYDRLLSEDPDNVRLLINSANCAVNTGDVDLALQRFHHADYLKAGDVEIQRGLAWAELLGAHYDKAEKLYSILLSGSPTSADWLNAGHNAHLMGSYRKAADRYHKAAEGAEADFEIAYTADIPTLRRLGASDDSIYILLDEIL
jgi:hypothetical protein